MRARSIELQRLAGPASHDCIPSHSTAIARRFPSQTQTRSHGFQRHVHSRFFRYGALFLRGNHVILFRCFVFSAWACALRCLRPLHSRTPFAALCAAGVRPQRASAALGRRAPAAKASRAPVRVQAVQAPAKEGPIILDGQVLHSISSERLDVIKSLDDFASNEVRTLLPPLLPPPPFGLLAS